MSKGNSEERVRMIESFGGKVVLVDQASNSRTNMVTSEDLKLVDIEYKRLIKELNAYPINQFDNEYNPLAHYLYTAKEIINDLPSVDAFVDYLGTGGSFCGVSKALKEYNKDIVCASIVPNKVEHLIQGGGYFQDIPFMDESLVDLQVTVSEEEALNAMDMLSKYEGICGGISSGANLIGAIRLLQTMPDKKVVFLVNDISLKYNSIIKTKK